MIPGAGHDCGWLECDPYSCKAMRAYTTPEALAAHWNIKPDGTHAGLPFCGGGRFFQGGCTLPEGHQGNCANSPALWAQAAASSDE